MPADLTAPVNGVLTYLYFGDNTELSRRYANQSLAAEEKASNSAAAAEGAAGINEYASVAEGEAATPVGSRFSVRTAQPGVMLVYERIASGSNFIRTVLSGEALAAPTGAEKMGTAPAIGSPLIFGTADSRVRYDIDLTGAPFNMRPGEDADQSSKLTDAVDAWKQAGGERRKIVLPSGKLKWGTTADLTGVNSGYFGSILGDTNRNLTISGAGRDQTILVGGEPDFGFMEITDSSALVLEDFSIHAPNSGADQCQYGILGGRTTGNASTGFIQMHRISVAGRFTKWPIFLMSVENSQILEPVIWSVLGNGIALAMNNVTHDMEPKYLPLGSGLGGNGANKIISPWMASLNLAEPDSRLLLLEFTQDAVIQNAYFVSSHAEAHIRLGKRATMHLDGAQHEWDPFGSGLPGALDPISVEFASGDTGVDPFDIAEYRCTKISNSRLRSIYGEDGSKVIGLDLDGSNVLKSFHDGYALNFDTLQDSNIDLSKKLLDVTGNAARVDTNIRTANGGNTFGAGIDRLDVVAPFPSLDAYIDVETGQSCGALGMSTIPGAAVALSGMFAGVTAPGTESVAIYLDWTVPDLSNLTDRCIIGLGDSAESLGGVGTMSMALYGGQLLLRSFGDTGGDINYYGTADPAFVQKFRNKRIKMLLVREKSAVAPKLYIDGSLVQIGQTTLAGDADWSAPITADTLLVGYQDSTPANNCPAIYHAAGLFNFAPTFDQASEITRFGLPAALRWGGAYGGPPGCVGWWDMASGTGTRVLDESPNGQHGTTLGTVARLQSQMAPIYRTNAGTPVGAVYPNYIGEELLNTTAKTWFKATGLGNNDWQAL
ncbi:hypothetical protein [Novosphingobium sp. HII-3]|uniref:hypothetical protein n=1 Tax=Novosphingobium sp. HII-3 TaxID=2075565 RepID=UPI000CDB801D|nr:hypothetical protein [Novosphingobium sp. HII-3]